MHIFFILPVAFENSDKNTLNSSQPGKGTHGTPELAAVDDDPIFPKTDVTC